MPKAKPKKLEPKKPAPKLHYCDIAKGHPIHGPYHDREYGFSARSTRVLFERLALEIMQAGLSWEIVLKKRKALNAAFDRFDPEKVSVYSAADIERLMGDSRIIRNRRKIEAVVVNAARLGAIRESHGSFARWLDAHHPQSCENWIILFKKSFVFMGPEVVREFLMSLGYLPGAHKRGCPVEKLLRARRAR
jgi:DNA-3-methyladenine glycosylase I